MTSTRTRADSSIYTPGRFFSSQLSCVFTTNFRTQTGSGWRTRRGRAPNALSVDCLVGTDAIEIKWRDAATDGDHITKEHASVQVTSDVGYTPTRVMFYDPNRMQAMKIKAAMARLDTGIRGAYYQGDSAWGYVKTRTGSDRDSLLVKPAAEEALSNGG